MEVANSNCGTRTAGRRAFFNTGMSAVAARGGRTLWIALKPLAVYGLCLLAILTLSRAILVSWQLPRVLDANMLWPVFIQGLRFDLVLLGLTLALPLLLFPLLVSTRRLIPWWRRLLGIYLPSMLVIALFMECSTPSFILQFDSRPNILFLEYLSHPREVGATLLATQKLALGLALSLSIVIAWIAIRQFKLLSSAIRPVNAVPLLLATPVLLALCVGMVRSTADHRPVNPSTVALSSDPLANDLALNSMYTALYALYELRHERAGGFRYGDISDAEIVKHVRDSMLIDPHDFISERLPTLHRQQVSLMGMRPKNLVIILQESLGAEFVGRLGGLPLTPNLDKLAREGLWFEHLYATGTRSVRGIEAIVSGFTPTPARSVVKLGKSQRDFFTLAGLLSQSGYDASFIYGGEAQFDNMRRFFMNNGFARVIDKHDYENPVFTGSWGVSDEDLFARAHEEFSAAGEQPFFSLVFTSTNHTPFEFPDNRITLYDREKNTVNNAVKYADYALGDFFDAARQSGYWDNTVFLVVADHNSRVYGAELLPVERFHVPALILGGVIKPAVFKPVASQIDLGPTLLSLIGISSIHPMIGRDLTRPELRDHPGRAIMQYNTTQGYLEGDNLIVLRKDMPVIECLYRDATCLMLDEVDPDLAARALAHSAWSSMAYQNRLHRPGSVIEN